MKVRRFVGPADDTKTRIILQILDRVREARDAAGGDEREDILQEILDRYDTTAIRGTDRYSIIDIGEDAIRELCSIITRDEAGRHFTEGGIAPHWRDLEEAGLIKVDRPVHDQTGIPYSEEHYSLEITEAGQDLADANPELHPAR